MKSHKHLWEIIFAIILIVTLALLAWFVIDVHTLYRANRLVPSREFNKNFIYRQQTPSPDQIESWMTFSYVNYIFNLPSDYIAASLSISDARYPELQIGAYARSQNTDVDTFLQQVQTIVARYSTSTPQ